MYFKEETIKNILNFSTISTTWCNLSKEDNVLVITDNSRYDLAMELTIDNKDFVNLIEIINIDTMEISFNKYSSLKPNDLLIVLVSIDSYINKGLNKTFPAFKKPYNLASKYAMIRLDIPRDSLLKGLNTRLDDINSTLQYFNGIKNNTFLNVKTDNGSDISMKVRTFKYLPYQIKQNGHNVYLPPAEVYTAPVEGSANGIIIVDVTVGELRVKGKLINKFGLVDEPVTIKVTNGIITSIDGGQTALKLNDELNKLDSNCKIIAELGHGLSNMTPTGIIGVDESIISTCHFGIGNNLFYGGNNDADIHLDVVIDSPKFKVIEE